MFIERIAQYSTKLRRSDKWRISLLRSLVELPAESINIALLRS